MQTTEDRWDCADDYSEDEAFQPDQECDDFYEDREAPVPWHPEGPPLGELSLGPVWVACPKIAYNREIASVERTFGRLKTAQAEELCTFLCSLPQLCHVDNCESLNRDVVRAAFVREAYDKNACIAAQRQFSELEHPERHFEPDFADVLLAWAEMKAKPKRKKQPERIHIADASL